MPLLFARHGRRRMGAAYQAGIHLNFATGVHYVKPAGGPATIAPFTSLFTFTGGNQSMYRGASGLLVASATNTPRIEYDANGNLLGLLIEGARTNIGLWSDDGTNAAWVKSNMTNAKTSTGPDGVANSATRLTASAGNATILQTVTSGSATRAYSVWLKRITGTGNIDLTVDNGSTWTTKTITTSWARYDISQAAVTNPVFGIRIVTSGDAVDFYGNQLESASFPSSYIPTTTGSVARAAGAISRTPGSEVSSTVGTVALDLDFIGTSENGGAPFALSTDSSNFIAIRDAGAASTISYLIHNGGVAQASYSESFLPVNTMFKYAAAWQANNFNKAKGGTLGTDDTSGSIPAVTTLRLGLDMFGGTMFGHIRRLDYWPERKSNAFLQQVTA